MTTLPTCWWCRAPGCGFVAHRNIEHHDMIEVPIIPPGTPLTDILDALGYTYQASRIAQLMLPPVRGPVSICSAMEPPLAYGTSVLVVDNPATDEEA